MTRTRTLLLAAAVLAAATARAQSCNVTQVLENIAWCEEFIGDVVPVSAAVRGWCYLVTSACIVF